MPSMRTVRTTPPAPGSRPRVTSGRPNCDFGLSSAMRRLQASAISRPPPRAAPFRGAAVGERLRVLGRDLREELQVTAGEEGVLRGGDDDAGHRLLLGLEAVERV